MALTINPAVSGTNRKWARDSVSFFIGTFFGATASLLVILGILALVNSVLPRTWLAYVVAPPILWAVLHDLGIQLPLPYRQQQVPESLRDELPTAAVAFVYGFQLGIGFLTLFTYSTQLAFILALPLIGSTVQVLLGIALFALGKSIVLATALGTKDVEEIPGRFRSTRLQARVLRLTNAGASVAILIALLVGS